MKCSVCGRNVDPDELDFLDVPEGEAVICTACQLTPFIAATGAPLPDPEEGDPDPRPCTGIAVGGRYANRF